MAVDVGTPSLLPIEAHLAGLRSATDRLSRAARATWLGASVPTCPDWSVLDLVAHQGMVHRWAIHALRGDKEGMGNATSLETEGRTSVDPIAWLEHGAGVLLRELDAAPDDLETVVFLKEAPAAKAFWARRQCHETTIHAVDATTAATGRPVLADDAWFDADLALDGIDELLIGFWQRSRGGIRSPGPYAVLVRPDDAPVAWSVALSDGPVVTRRVDPAAEVEADAVLSGSAIDLYLALWNRGGSPHDPGGALDRFRGGAVNWA